MSLSINEFFNSHRKKDRECLCNLFSVPLASIRNTLVEIIFIFDARLVKSQRMHKLIINMLTKKREAIGQ